MSANELAHAASPYLLQHRANPVHWREWTPATLAVAKAESKPILLSIGYAACHWCHVMAHESFEDESTAEMMNQLFISIKVDREERPDIDQIYMAALHALGQPGGWPLTMFLTPAGEPFWGGTYFPKENAHGRPSFKQVLQEVSRIYRDSPDKVANNTSALRTAITELEHTTSNTQINNNLLDEFARRLYPHMDMDLGGLQGAPKFPNTQILELFSRAAERTGENAFNAPVHMALKRMCQGGIHDHVGGGFARYSVDDRWHVPHFEKMLYDNAQILEMLALAWAQTRDETFQHAAESIVAWLKRDMITLRHMFAASQDADSEGVEGKFYCWTKDEIENSLTSQEAQLFCAHYDIQPGGNWQEMHTGMRTNVLNRLHNIASGQAIEATLAISRNKLLAIRRHRVPPPTDDKILADWNGLMVAALARASIIFNQPDWLDLARACFHSVIESMAAYDGDHLRTGHSYRAQKLVWPGVSSDYAYLIRASLILNECGAPYHEASNIPDIKSYLELAIKLTRSLIEYHAHPGTGVLSLSARDTHDVIYKTYITQDDATPNPNSIFLQSLQILASATGEHFYTAQANKMIHSITPRAIKNPFGHASFLNAIDARLNSAEIIITGDSCAAFMQAARDGMFLNRFILELDQPSILSSQRFKPARNNRPTAYICMGERCSLPVETPEAIASAIAQMKSAR